MNSLMCTRVHARLTCTRTPKFSRALCARSGARFARAFLNNLVPPNPQNNATPMAREEKSWKRTSSNGKKLECLIYQSKME